MDKNRLVAEFLGLLDEELTRLKSAALSTKEAATNPENKPENQYDTRALEASYLAGAQAKRAGELEEVVSLFRAIKLMDLGALDVVATTALVTLRIDGKPSKVFIMPKGGGLTCKIDGESVQIVTPASPLGDAIVGLRAGDSTEFENGPATREVKIIAVQ